MPQSRQPLDTQQQVVGEEMAKKEVIVKVRCSYCGNQFDETLDKCPYCGAKHQSARTYEHFLIQSGTLESHLEKKRAHLFGSDYVDEDRVSSFTGTGRVALLPTTTTLIVWPGDVFSSRALYRIAEHSSNQQTYDDCRDQNCG